jgi:hypothetical protein
MFCDRLNQIQSSIRYPQQVHLKLLMATLTVSVGTYKTISSSLDSINGPIQDY